MGSQTTKRKRTKRTVRTAIVAGSLIVAGCFTAAFTLAVVMACVPALRPCACRAWVAEDPLRPR